MATRNRMRPAGTDGADHGYRMLIESKYKQLARNRRRVELFTFCSSAVLLAQSTWQTLPALLKGQNASVSSLILLGSAILNGGLYLYGFGFGKAQREKLSVIKMFGIFQAAIMAQVLLYGFQHARLLPNIYDTHSLLSFPMLLDPSQSRHSGTNLLALAMNTLSLILLAATATTCLQYVRLKSLKLRDR